MTPSQRLVGNFHRDKSPSDTGYSFNETPSTAWTRTQTAPTPGRRVHGDALEPNAAGRSLLRVLRRRDRVSVGSE